MTTSIRVSLLPALRVALIAVPDRGDVVIDGLFGETAQRAEFALGIDFAQALRIIDLAHQAARRVHHIGIDRIEPLALLVAIETGMDTNALKQQQKIGHGCSWNE